MTRSVLYANDFEPITIIELNSYAWQLLHTQGRLRVPVRLRANNNAEFKMVSIRAERLVRGDETHLLLFTDDDESALMMKAAFLPGQLNIMQTLERNAFAYGFMIAMKAIGG